MVSLSGLATVRADGVSSSKSKEEEIKMKFNGGERKCTASLQLHSTSH